MQVDEDDESCREETEMMTRDLVDENPEQPKRGGEAAVRPLEEEEEEAGGGAVGYPHREAGAIVVPREIRGRAMHECSAAVRHADSVSRAPTQL
jgi:hypothetical protein